MAGFKTGLALGALATGAVALWALEKVDAEPIRFPTKSVNVTDGYIAVVGSIVGDEPAEAERPVNNMVEMFCRADEMSCTFLSVNEIAPRLVGLPSTDTLAIRRWTDREMVADSLVETGPMGPCAYYEVRVIFESQDVTYTRLPNAQADQERCREFFDEFLGGGPALKQWRIDDGKGSYDYQPGTS